MATTRVHLLANELGVKSEAIIKKCQAEGVPNVKNHMSTISAGLAATIREWFSEGDNVTTVETSDKVDLERVRVKRKPKKEAAEEKAPEVQEAPAAEATETAVQEAVPAEAAAESPKVEQQPAAIEPQTEQAVAVEQKPIEPVKEPVKAPVEVKPAPVVAVIEPKKKPEPVKPAGPMLERPAPAKLSGPQIVRVEAPEPIAPARPRGRGPSYTPFNQLLTAEKPAAPEVEEEGKGKKRPAKHGKDRTSGRRAGETEDEFNKRTKTSTLRRQRDIEERQARLIAAGGEGLRMRPMRKIASKAHGQLAAPVKPKKLTINEPITVKDLSAALAVKAGDIMSKLIEQGVMVTANQAISAEMAELVALEFGTELVITEKKTLEEQIKHEFEQRSRENVKKRPVVATVLGHVDHGKTSLLDRIRSTQVAAGEAGGITQHIGASQVTWGEKTVVFLDTPGHEAFTAMRARGANMTDVVVLVVAADDGVMPQTIEAMHHAKAANVPVIIALNKTDLPGVDFNRIYAQFAEHGLVPVEWGGQTEVVKTSAVTGAGVNDLLEHLDYVADLMELKADDSIPATGWVIEAKLSDTQGPVATVLIKEGRLNKGDIILAGSIYGRIKTLKNSYGKSIKTATSSMPVEITGLSAVPQAGDRFYCLDDINKAKAAAEENAILARESALAKRTMVTLDNLFSQIEAGSVKELNLILRADVQGSVDVLTKYLSELSTNEVKIKILHASTGGITEGDVVLAEASNAIIIGFSVVPDERVARIAESKGVEVRLYNIIYRITEDLQKSMTGLLEPETKEKSLGRATVRTIFKVSKIGTVAGCYVTDGVAAKSAKVRLIRDNVVIRDDLTIETLKHFKDDVREVKAGMECGIKLAKFDDVKTEDILNFYEFIKVARTLSQGK